MSEKIRQLVLVAVAAVIGASAASLLSMGVQAASPGEPTPPVDLAALRREVNELRREVSRTPAPSVGSAPSRSAHTAQLPEPGPPTERPFDDERTDRDWAEPTEGAIRELLGAIQGVSAESIECRSDRCRARLGTTDMLAMQRLQVEAVRELGATAVAAISLPERSDAFEVTFTLPRDREP